jgi:hypothetical protein
VKRAFALACVIALTSCGESLSSPAAQAERLKAIDSEIDVDLPASSVVLEYYEPQSSFNRLWVAKVRVPETSFVEVKETILKKTDVSHSVDQTQGLPESISWWKPVDIDFAREYQPSGGDMYVKVVASKEKGERILYIYGVP